MIELRTGDCLDVLSDLDAESVDSVVTDPPYGISFMGKHWDRFDIERRVGARDVSHLGRLTGGADSEGRKVIARTASAFATPASAAGAYDFSAKGNRAFQAWCEAWASECLRVLKPGGHLVSFGGTRTYHRLVCGVEDAGFEIRDQLAWLFGQGFPKSMNVGCRCEAEEGNGNGEPSAERRVRRVRKADLPAPLDAAGEPDEDLLEGVPESNLPLADGAESEEGQVGSLERVVEGRRDVLAEGGKLPADQVRAGADVGVADGSEGRLRDGASSRYGEDGRALAVSCGGRPSPRPRSDEQRRVELGALADESRSQALGGWPLCARCGLPTDGLGTALKPGYEPIVLARKPVVGTVAANVLAYGTGALNIDGCRIEASGRPHITADGGGGHVNCYGDGLHGSRSLGTTDAGRWPANVVLDEPAAAMLDEQTGDLTSRLMAAGTPRGPDTARNALGKWGGNATETDTYGDSGGASRFFYVPKVDAAERQAGLAIPSLFAQDGPERNNHPTVKPIQLMRWLIRLVTPPGGLVLDPFLGSGSTGCAAALEGFRFLGIERDPDYMRIAQARISHWASEPVDAA